MAFNGNPLKYVDRNGLDNWNDAKAGQNAVPYVVFAPTGLPPGFSPPTNPSPPPAPSAPTSHELGFGPTISGGGALGMGPGLGADFGITSQITTKCRVCVTISVGLTLGVSTPGLFGTAGGTLSYGVKGLDGLSYGFGPALKVGEGGAGSVNLEVTSSQAGFPKPAGGNLSFSGGIGIGTIAGVRLSVSCTGCAGILQFGSAAGPIASALALKCVHDKADELKKALNEQLSSP